MSVMTAVAPLRNLPAPGRRGRVRLCTLILTRGVAVAFDVGEHFLERAAANTGVTPPQRTLTPLGNLSGNGTCPMQVLVALG